METQTPKGSIQQMLEKASLVAYMIDKTYQKSVELDRLVNELSILEDLVFVNYPATAGLNVAMSIIHKIIAAVYDYKSKVAFTKDSDPMPVMKDWVIKEMTNLVSMIAMSVGYTAYKSLINDPIHIIFVPKGKDYTVVQE